MRAWPAAVSIVLIATLVAPPETWAARRDPSDWGAAVQRGLERGARITVRLGAGETVTGRLATAEEDHLSLRGRGVVRTISRSEIREVRRAGRSPFRKLAGLILGAAAGAVIGSLAGAALTQCQDCEYPGLIGFVFGFLIGAVGGGISGVILAAKGEGALVYRAGPQPSAGAAAS
jgi:hypothetical protein